MYVFVSLLAGLCSFLVLSLLINRPVGVLVGLLSASSFVGRDVKMTKEEDTFFHS